MNEKRLNSLIKLLDDPDDSVFRLVLQEFRHEDISVVEQLEHVWETSLEEIVQQRIELIIKKIQLRDTKERIEHWANQEKIDLFEGIFLISRHQYPDITLRSVQYHLDRIRKDVWLEFRNSLTSLEKITILNHIFFDHFQFKINLLNRGNPNNCYINKILETHTGNPVSIAILYILIARSLNLPVHYIDIPQNPLIGYFDKDIAFLAHPDEHRKPVLFYINPANNGAIIGPKEVDYIQNIQGTADRARLVEPCPDKIVIRRLVELLAESYELAEEFDQVNYLKSIASILKSD